MEFWPVIERIEHTGIGTAIRESTWLFPCIESGHLLALALMGGAVLLVDLRMLGVGVVRVSVAETFRDARPWLLTSLAALVLTGVPLFMSEATRCAASPAFWVKLASLVVGTAYTFTVHQRVAIDGAADADPRRSRRIAVVSLALWAAVGIAGRAVAFY